MADATDTDYDPEPADSDRDIKVLDRHVAMLREHFDAVEIIAVRHISDETGTVQCCKGGGNWYARAAAVREWMLRSDHRTRVQIEREDDD